MSKKRWMHKLSQTLFFHRFLFSVSFFFVQRNNRLNFLGYVLDHCTLNFGGVVLA